jgi:hypothetical protein
MKTKVQKLTATRINVRLKVSEAKNLVGFLDAATAENITPAQDAVATKIADLLTARINKETKEETDE